MNDYLDPVQPHRDALALMTAARNEDREGVLAVLDAVPLAQTPLLLAALADHGAAAFDADPAEGWDAFADDRRVVFARAEARLQEDHGGGEPDPEPGRD